MGFNRALARRTIHLILFFKVNRDYQWPDEKICKSSIEITQQNFCGKLKIISFLYIVWLILTETKKIIRWKLGV